MYVVLLSPAGFGTGYRFGCTFEEVCLANVIVLYGLQCCEIVDCDCLITELKKISVCLRTSTAGSASPSVSQDWSGHTKLFQPEGTDGQRRAKTDFNSILILQTSSSCSPPVLVFCLIYLETRDQKVTHQNIQRSLSGSREPPPLNSFLIIIFYSFQFSV